MLNELAEVQGAFPWRVRRNRRCLVSIGARELVRSAVTDGKVETTSELRVPAPIRAALLRGLMPDPDARHPSLNSLLAALSYDPARVWRRALIGVIADDHLPGEDERHRGVQQRPGASSANRRFTPEIVTPAVTLLARASREGRRGKTAWSRLHELLRSS